MEIIPGILEKDWVEIERKIDLVKPFAKAIHIDIIDGRFSPNTTFLDPKPFSKFSREVLLEAHLMVEEPINYLKPFADAGFKRFLGHIEMMSDQVEFVAQGQILGEVGLAVDGPTSLQSVKVPLDDLDCVLIMAIKAGEAGQKFIPKHLKKIEDIRKMPNGEFAQIEVDGGINDKTVVEAKSFGANRFVANSFLFNSKDPKAQYRLLEEKIK